MLVFIMISPALLVMTVAQIWIKSAYRKGMRVPAPLSGNARCAMSGPATEVNPSHSGRLSDHSVLMHAGVA